MIFMGTVTLQQYLPLAVLKPGITAYAARKADNVATVLTACGIETPKIANTLHNHVQLQQYLPLAVLKQS